MTTTKESLIKYFSTLDIPTLEKLRKYSELIIIPEEDLLTNATMSQMVTKAHDLADSLFPEWTDRSKSDFGEFLVELFALFSEKDFWYINAFANEGLMNKMRSYSNAFAKASTLGYYPTTCKGAEATFSVIFVKGEELTYNRGDLVISVGDKEFNNSTPFTLERSSDEVTKNLTLKEGKQLVEDVTYDGHSIYLSKSNIDVDSIEVVMDNISFTRVRNFGNSGKDSYHFMVLPEEDGSCSIYFGRDSFGVQPALGKTITVMYTSCSGEEGNIDIDVATVSDSNDSREASLATMLTPAGNGCYAESFTSIREMAPISFAYKKAAINETTAQAILDTYPFVHQSKVWNIGNDLYYSVIPTSGKFEPTEAEKKFMVDNFEPCLMMGYTAIQVGNRYVNIHEYLSADEIILDVVISMGYNATTIEEQVRQFMGSLTNPLVGATYGQSFNKVNAEASLRYNVPGIHNVSFIQVTDGEETPIGDFTLAPQEIFYKIDQSKLSVRINAI